MYGMEVMLFEGYALTGWAYWRHYRRLLPGCPHLGLFLPWGMVWPVAEFLGLLHIRFPADVIWDLPKYFVAFGMIVTLFENQTRSCRWKCGAEKGRSKGQSRQPGEEHLPGLHEP